MRTPVSYLSSSPRGSVLVFSMIILAFLLVSGISIATVANSETRSSLSVDRSSVAFQAADGGAETILVQVYSGDYDACPGSGSCQLSQLGPCSNGVISGTIGQSAYQVTFYTASGQITSCSNTDWRTQALRIKSVGTHGSTVRAIEAGIDTI